MLVVKPFLATTESAAMSKEDVLSYCGKAFGMCYLQDEFERIENEDREKSIKRALMCIKSGHHSGFEHAKFTFCITGISKMLAMILNNQGKYATSEKSGRYTVLDMEDPIEIELREKWQGIFYDILKKKYYDTFRVTFAKPGLEEEKIEKKVETAIVKRAQEVSRMMTTVFTKTKMIYSIDVRQLSYLRYEMKNFVENEKESDFYKKIKVEMKEFLEATNAYGFEDEGLNPASKGVTLPFFHDAREEEFGLNYSINSKVSWSAFAQNQRHRTVRCTIEMPRMETKNDLEKIEYFVPEFIKDSPELVEEWLSDLKERTAAGEYPQAMLVTMNERGRYEDFVQKSFERLCGAAQYEIMKVTKEQLDKYLANVTSEEAKDELLKISTGARCTFGYKCTSPCVGGPKIAITRDF